MNRSKHTKGCSCCESPNYHSTLLDRNIEDVGFSVIPIIGSNPPYAFTLGLTETLGCPELYLTCDMDLMDLAKLLGTFAIKLVKQCRNKDQSYIDAVFRENECSFLMIINSDYGPKSAYLGLRLVDETIFSKHDMMGTAINRYGLNGFKVAQVIVPDAKGKLPWHIGFDQSWGFHSKQTPMYRLQECDKVPIAVEECGNCKLTLSKLLMCSRCKSEHYCGGKCQKEHWDNHKDLCRSIYERDD